jgi:hypothetical protein
MFKSVKYEGFENAPELRQVCEGLTFALECIRHLPHELMSFRWILDRLDLAEVGGATVVCELSHDWTGTDRLRVGEALLRDREEMVRLIRRMWYDMNDRFLGEKIRGFNLTPALQGVE